MVDYRTQEDKFNQMTTTTTVETRHPKYHNLLLVQPYDYICVCLVIDSYQGKRTIKNDGKYTQWVTPQFASQQTV